MFTKVGKIEVTCIRNCKPCPMDDVPVSWEALTKPPCCNSLWIPASYLTQATGKDRTIDRGKAMKLFLQSLEVL